MKKKSVKIVVSVLGAVVVLAALVGVASAAYGPAGHPLGTGAHELAAELEVQTWGEDGKLSEVTCLRASARSFTCMGTMKADGEEHPASYDVTVSFRGMWIASAT